MQQATVAPTLHILGAICVIAIGAVLLVSVITYVRPHHQKPYYAQLALRAVVKANQHAKFGD